MTAANDLAVRRALESAGVEFIDEIAADRASVSANLSGQNNPNKKQPLEIALEREGISFIAEPGGGFGVRLEKKPQRG
jgi:hypothetical protein